MCTVGPAEEWHETGRRDIAFVYLSYGSLYAFLFVGKMRGFFLFVLVVITR